MQVCTSLQTDNHASTPPLSFLDRMPFLPPNQQRQSTEGTFALQQAATLHNLFDTISDSLISQKYKSRFKKTISLTKNWGCLEKTFTKIVKQ